MEKFTGGVVQGCRWAPLLPDLDNPTYVWRRPRRVIGAWGRHRKSLAKGARLEEYTVGIVVLE